MKLNKNLFLTFLIILILIIPNAIYANEVDLGINSYNMMEDDSNLMLDQDNSSGHDLNSINGIGDVKNEISSTVDAENSLELDSSGSSTLDEKDYLVSENDNSSEDKTSEGFFNEDEFSNNMLD